MKPYLVCRKLIYAVLGTYPFIVSKSNSCATIFGYGREIFVLVAGGVVNECHTSFNGKSGKRPSTELDPWVYFSILVGLFPCLLASDGNSLVISRIPLSTHTMTLENVGAPLASICSPIEVTSFPSISLSESADPFPAEDDTSLLAATKMVDIGGR